MTEVKNWAEDFGIAEEMGHLYGEIIGTISRLKTRERLRNKPDEEKLKVWASEAEAYLKGSKEKKVFNTEEAAEKQLQILRKTLKKYSDLEESSNPILATANDKKVFAGAINTPQNPNEKAIQGKNRYQRSIDGNKSKA